MVSNNIYYLDFKAGYISIKDIPYKYWDNDVVNYALSKEPHAYYECLLGYTLEGMTGLTVKKCLETIPSKYKTEKLYKQLLEYDGSKYGSLVPLEMRDKIKLKSLKPEDLLANFKYIDEANRTPQMYKQLSKISFDDYLMYVVNYNGIPDIYRTKSMCLGLFYGNIDKYVSEIPDEYKSVELGKLLVKIDFRKYFPKLPEDCRTSEMYEEYVAMNPVAHIDKVPKEKRTQKMYELLFDYTLDTYLDKIPKEFISKEMYHRLIRINPAKYLHMTPEEYLDQTILADIVEINPYYFNLLPVKLLTKDFYLLLIKRNPLKYLKYLPEEYYTDEVINEIVNILKQKRINLKLNINEKLNRLILDKQPLLISQFTIPAIHDIIKYELVVMVNTNGDIADIMRKYHIKSDIVMNVLKSLKKENKELFKTIDSYLNGDFVYQKYNNIGEDLKKLEQIVISLGNVSRKTITTNQKLEFAYLVKKYLKYSLEDIYAYNNSNRNKCVSTEVNSFIEFVLAYSLYADTYNGMIDIKKITHNNEWLKDFNYLKFFDIRDNVAHSKHIYGEKQMELTLDLATQILNRLKIEEIPLNLLIVNMAFRRYFMGELDLFIKELHSFDTIFDKPKRKKR